MWHPNTRLYGWEWAGTGRFLFTSTTTGLKKKPSVELQLDPALEISQRLRVPGESFRSGKACPPPSRLHSVHLATARGATLSHTCKPSRSWPKRIYSFHMTAAGGSMPWPRLRAVKNGPSRRPREAFHQLEGHGSTVLSSSTLIYFFTSFKTEHSSLFKVKWMLLADFSFFEALLLTDSLLYICMNM